MVAPLSSVTDALLRPALEAALAVAREGEEETPALPAPTPLRPFLRFAKLPPRALAATRRALDSDEVFRGRVAEAATEDGVGRAGWLFLTRPEGWEEELRSIVSGAEEVAHEEEERRAEQDARKRLPKVQEAVRRAEEEAAAARSDAMAATAALAEERRLRHAATEEAAAANRRAQQAVFERDRARSRAEAAAAEVEDLQRRLSALEAELTERAAELSAVSPPPWAPEAQDPDAPGPALNEEVGRALADAAAAATRLADSLAKAATVLVPPPAPGVPVPETPAPAPVAPEPALRPLVAARRPVSLPPAIYDDSLEAAEYLLRVNGVVLIVDGYNVSLAGWPEQPLPEQRRRLVSALGELAARTGADVRVVFDGSEMAMPGVVPTTPQAVRVSFSPPGIEADDVVLGAVSELPPHRPVVVASSDRRVQDGATAEGANVISAPQLLSLLRR